MRVRLRGETTWSGTLPIEDQMPNYKQHCVVQVRDISEQCLALVYCIMKFMNNFKIINISYIFIIIYYNLLQLIIIVYYNY